MVPPLINYGVRSVELERSTVHVNRAQGQGRGRRGAFIVGPDESYAPGKECRRGSHGGCGRGPSPAWNRVTASASLLVW